jgi:hypothetical protein
MNLALFAALAAKYLNFAILSKDVLPVFML